MDEGITENRSHPENDVGIFDKAALEATQVNYITGENAGFKDAGGFLTMNGKRVTLHRLFPYDTLTHYISVLDMDKRELGIIKDTGVFDDEQKNAISAELARKYYLREIVKIEELKDRHGTTFWQVKTSDNPDGTTEFTLRDTYGSMFRVSDTHIIISDTDGNRFSIPDVKKLDKKSYRRIELYL